MALSIPDASKRPLLEAAASVFVASFKTTAPGTQAELERLVEDATPDTRNAIVEALWWFPYQAFVDAVTAELKRSAP